MTKPAVYTAIGDSLSFGTGAPEGEGFVQTVFRDWRNSLFAGREVILNNFSVVGATTGETLERLLTDSHLRRAVASSDVVTLTAGGNDLIRTAMRMYIQGEARTMKPGMRVFMRAYQDLLAELTAVHRTMEREDGLMIVVNCYNPFPQVRDALLWIGFVNRCIRRCASAYGDKVRVADAYSAFLGRERQLLADDGVHPNAEGHRQLAACVAEAAR